jgi:MoaA/NifB/PqqE/SkfB family radical SAM enzyme
MDPVLYTRILDELRKTGTAHSLLLMLQNEPLLDPDLAGRVREAKEILGRKVQVAVITNGSLLSSSRIDELLDAGIDRLDISIDAYREETFQKIRKGLDFSKVIRNMHSLIGRNRRAQIWVRFLKQRANAGEEREFAQYWKSKGANVFIFPLDNRVGWLGDYTQMKVAPGTTRRYIKAIWSSLLAPCVLPFIYLNVLWDGRVILCCRDWVPKDTVGDLSHQSVPEIWNSESINRYRHLLWTRRIEDSLVCRDCSAVRSSAI